MSRASCGKRFAASQAPSPAFWPEATLFSSLAHLSRWPAELHANQLLTTMWPSGHPVVLSSGRAALTWAVKLFGLARADSVRLFPFASHCVIDAVGRIATPTGHDSDKLKAESGVTLHHHQWGYEMPVHEAVGELIEDSVDSLYVPGSRLFASGGRFEIWSLSKILGTMGGGVLWCKNLGDAEAVRDFIGHTKNHPSFRWAARAAIAVRQLPMTSALWSSAENLSSGAPSRLLMMEIESRIHHWAILVEERNARLRRIANSQVRLLEFPVRSDRLPCMLPVLTDGKRIEQLAGIGLPKELRHFMNNVGKMIPVYPLPIHQGVSDNVFEKALSILEV